MKTLKLFTLLFAAGIIAFSCKPEPGPEPDTAQQTFAKALVGTWTADEIRKDNADITVEYPGFAIEFAANTTNATAITGTIEASNDELDGVGFVIGSGTWTFSGSTGVSTITLAGEAQITAIEFINPTPADAPTSVGVKFTRNDITGRMKGLTGNYVIQLSK